MILPTSAEGAKELPPGMIDNVVAEALMVSAVVSPSPKASLCMCTLIESTGGGLCWLSCVVVQDFPKEYVTGQLRPRDVSHALGNSFPKKVCSLPTSF
jgi:hypothetical protein